MAILTTQQVHARNWIKCPRCEGGALFTARDRKQGAICVSCGNTGEVALNARQPVVTGRVEPLL